MTAPAPSPYGSAADWSKIISASAEGAGNAMQGATAYANNKKEAKEAKRRTLANLLNQSIKRNQGLSRLKQEYGGEMRDYQSQALQKVAQGFASALQGSTG